MDLIGDPIQAQEQDDKSPAYNIKHTLCKAEQRRQHELPLAAGHCFKKLDSVAGSCATSVCWNVVPSNHAGSFHTSCTDTL